MTDSMWMPVCMSVWSMAPPSRRSGRPGSAVAHRLRCAVHPSGVTDVTTRLCRARGPCDASGLVRAREAHAERVDELAEATDPHHAGRRHVVLGHRHAARTGTVEPHAGEPGGPRRHGV